MRSRPAVRILAGFVAVALGALVLGNAFVLVREDGHATADPARAPHAQTAIVLGALVQPDGHMSLMLADRVAQAATLWRDGKVGRILVSGDHTRPGYDETDTMRNALLRDGVPGRDVFTDYAGVDTWATMVRARKVFGVRSAIVVTQDFHMPRALYLASAAGLSATGVTSDLHPYGEQYTASSVRELLARVKGIGQGVLDSPVLLGPPHPITGDGRQSWDPRAPIPG